MQEIKYALRAADSALVELLARLWGVNIDQITDTAEIIDLLDAAMHETAKIEKIWDGLSDEARGAMFALIGSPGAKMNAQQFELLFGKIRKMGEAQLETEKPDKRPQSKAEALFYKGLIAQGYENHPAGARAVVYVPQDLLPLLPVHKTAYANIENEPLPDYSAEEEEQDEDLLPDEDIVVEAVEAPVAFRQADTSLVDDMTTLLAFLQIHAAPIEVMGDSERSSEYRLPNDERDALMPHLLRQDEARLVFLLGLALSGDLLEVQNTRLYVKRAEARRWLSATRSEQVRALVQLWQTSRLYRDLWHVPGLFLEPGGSLDSYDPVVIREGLANFMQELAPAGTWWSIDSFIQAIKENDADFQRPEYDSWYIRNSEDEYLKGFESWEAVEGALLLYYLEGPLHWLGLLDISEEAARISAYGHAFLGRGPWPAPPEQTDRINLRDDGSLLLSRRVSRIDRFQVARFASWLTAGDPYTYKLDGRGMARAAEQGINSEQIKGFLSKMMAENAAIPAPVLRLLDSWRGGAAASVTIERPVILRTNSPDALEQIRNTPALNRYLGAQLGPTAVIVRADQWQALRDALGEAGIIVGVQVE